MDKKLAREQIKNKIIGVIRCDSFLKAKLLTSTIIKAGINVIEITFSVEDAPRLIKELKREYPNAIIGAGTVLSASQAKLALDNGADFIVAPCIVEEVGAFCLKNNVFCSMGAATPTEAFNSYRLGSDVVKLFPGEFINPGLIKGIKAPMPFIDMMPTGGVDHTNIRTWFENGAFAVGVGGYLTKNIDESNLDELKMRCELLVNSSK